MDGDEQYPIVASVSTANNNQVKPNDVHVMLAKAINRHKNIIINPSNSIPRDKISQEKERAWESVRKEMAKAGVQRFSTRTWRTVRDVDWQHLRRRVVNKIAENIKIYQTANKDLNELDFLVLDTLGKTNADGSIDLTDLIKSETTDETPKSVSSDLSENNFEMDNVIVASTNSLLIDMIEEYGLSNSIRGAKRKNSFLTPNDNVKKNCKDYQQNLDQRANSSTEQNGNLASSKEVRNQWEHVLRELGIGRISKEEETSSIDLRTEQERYRTEAEKYRSEQERYKVLQEKWKAEIEKIKLEEAKIKLTKLKKE